MHQRYFYRPQEEVIGSGVENTFKNHEKEHSGHDENNFFFYSIFYFTTFFKSSIFRFSPTIRSRRKPHSKYLEPNYQTDVR